MKIDVHTHIFPPEIVKDRERWFSGEPAFKTLYGTPKSRMISAESLVEVLDRDQVDRAVVFGFPWRNRETARRHNDYVLEAAARFPHRLLPMVCFDPGGSYAVAEARRGLDNGAVGLGELAVYEECAEETVLSVYEELAALCREKSAVLLVHANEPVGHSYPGKAPMGLRFYYEIARRCDGTPLILAHWGGGLFFFFLLKKDAPQVLDHVYYDTAASPFLYRPQIYRQAAEIVGIDRILWGTDHPLLPPSRYIKEMEEAGLDPEETTAVLGKNAARLFEIAAE